MLILTEDRGWGVQGGASSTLVEAPQAPDRPNAHQRAGVNSYRVKQ